MAQERNKKRKDKPEMTIFEEQKRAKVSAKELLEIAKKQEDKKLKQGYHYIVSADGKTMTLTNRKNAKPR